MTIRLSLRQKLIYTFLGGSLLTVVLFGAVIKVIMNDYFRRLAEVRLSFVSEQGEREIRANVAIFREGFQNIFDNMATTVGALAQSGTIGDHLPQTHEERRRMSEMLLRVQRETTISMITVLDLEGRVIVRGNNPDEYGDEALMRDYASAKPVSSIRRLVLNALAGHTIKSWETFPPEILAKHHLAETARIRLKSWTREVPPNTFEERGLVMTIAMPVRTSSGKLVGALVAGRLMNNDLSIVMNIQRLLGDRASIYLDDVRIASNATISRGADKGQNATGSLLNPEYDSVLTRGEFFHVRSEQQMGLYEPLKNYENQVIGALWIGRPLEFIASIDRNQREIEQTAASRTNIYVVLSGLISLLVAIGVAYLFSKRVTARIDQLRKGAEIIEKGMLGHRLRIQSGDEIELLSKQFNSMATKLEESHQTLERKVEERTRELTESQEAMVQQEKMIGVGQLAAGIAHEMNTPLGTVIGYAQMLREDLAQQPATRASLSDVDEIIGQAGRCRDLVKNLLNFSRRSSMEKRTASINNIVRKILSLVEHDFDMKGVHVHIDLDSDVPDTQVNENEIAQVILNLANNAVDSMPAGGDLRVSTKFDESSERICIEVHDTGCGIKESDRTRVFEPFFTTKEVGKGTGLGLSICYKIVENHLGSIDFDSVIAKGTTFRVYLPAKVHTEVGVG